MLYPVCSFSGKCVFFKAMVSSFRLLFLISTISCLPQEVKAHGGAGARAAAVAPAPNLQILVGLWEWRKYTIDKYSPQSWNSSVIYVYFFPRLRGRRPPSHQHPEQVLSLTAASILCRLCTGLRQTGSSEVRTRRTESFTNKDPRAVHGPTEFAAVYLYVCFMFS